MNTENATVTEAVAETDTTETETVVMQQANQPQTEDAPKVEAEAVTEVIEEKASSESDPEA